MLTDMSDFPVRQVRVVASLGLAPLPRLFFLNSILFTFWDGEMVWCLVTLPRLALKS